MQKTAAPAPAFIPGLATSATPGISRVQPQAMSYGLTAQLLRIMRLTTLFILAACLSVSASTSSQTITLKGKDLPMKKIFASIEEQTGYVVFYNQGLLANTHPVTVSALSMPLDKFMDMVLKDQPLLFMISDKTIVLSEKIIIPKPVPDPVLPPVDISGTIRNAAGDPLADVSITIKGSSTGTTTAPNGSFTMNNIPEDAVLQVSIVGYESMEITIKKTNNGHTAQTTDKKQARQLSIGAGNQLTLNITLNAQVLDLNEVVVTGYATQQRRAVTGSISRVRSKDIEKMPVQTLDAAIQGRMPGVQIQSQSGVPGGAIKVEIRGQGSITAGTNPLYIVDGIPINSDNSTTTVSTNPLAVINPKDIESIEVLKDAAAASVYGAQAGNGVVLITTKKGTAGATRFNLTLQTGFVKPINLMPLMNTQQYLGGRIEAMMNANPTRDYAWAKTQVLTQSKLPTTMTDEEMAALPTYDWHRAVYQTGKSNKADFSAAGGSGKTTYRISGSYENTTGSIVASRFKRGTVNLFLNSQISNKLSFSGNINLTSIKQNGPSGGAGSSTLFSSPAYAGPMMLPFIPIYKEDGTLNYDYNGFPGIFTQNPVHTSLLNDQEDKTAGLLANLQLQYKIIKGLTYKTTVGLDYRNIQGRRYVDPRTQEGYVKRGVLNTYQQTPKSFANTHTLNYQRTFNDKHDVNLIIGGEYRSFESESNSVTGEGFPNFEFRQMQSAALITGASGSWTGVKRMGTFFQANWFGSQRYMASAIIRYDGSSRFGANNMFGWFPAISIGWDMAQEDFLNKYNWIDQLKLRTGYGETGNDQIGNFVSRSLFGGGITYNNEPGIQPNSLGNANLRWERNATINLGLDFSFLQRRIFGSVEVYKRTSKDLLLSQPVPWIAGYEEIYNNVGEVVNKGLELEIGVHLVKSADFNWVSNFNISFLNNKVTKLYDTLQELPGDPSVRVGYSLKTNFYPQYAGVNSATGRPLFYDNAGNLSYNPPATTANAYTPFGRGNQLSDYYGGWNNTFSYKGFELGIFFQYDFGRELYNNQSRNMARKGDMNINGILWYYDNRWTTPGQITSVPRTINNAAEVNSARGDLASTRWLEDASYIRLKTINFSYRLPRKPVEKLGMQEISVFAQCLNVHTWTKWSGYDPEFFLDGENYTTYTGLIPQTRSFQFGITAKF
ncbi:SusC/RagA family TonB-linked outer membrane protein [Pseudobacter ginsenosidimutans]|uniref:TonB-linked SusC/RagA family outer membrane protein n=1 Tax=Pseudobacter ginsenosidimutans TaxID=661488 RepID=A0A4Q7MZE7_9BACT|nr:TonB-dependent receptor [Pseudobacter ginsenosidimutans]QEC43276.1 TonB-dependent receptor [Pseudobacter ginsenosidimutans]RZS74640.1 TonB-linked SusC/RagA family outer membrane protein [Pseudobacter ginsenosidimutans]